MSSSSNSGPQRLRRTKWGVYAANITREDIEKCFNLPSSRACRQLGVGLTILKRICRGFGIDRWPYRNKPSDGMEAADSLDESETPPPEAKVPTRRRRAAAQRWQQQEEEQEQHAVEQQQGEEEQCSAAEEGSASGTDALPLPKAEAVPRGEQSEQDEGSSKGYCPPQRRPQRQQCRLELRAHPYSRAAFKRQRRKQQRQQEKREGKKRGQLPAGKKEPARALALKEEGQLAAMLPAVKEEQLPACAIGPVCEAVAVAAAAAAGCLKVEEGQGQAGPASPHANPHASTPSGRDGSNCCGSSDASQGPVQEEQQGVPLPDSFEDHGTDTSLGSEDHNTNNALGSICEAALEAPEAEANTWAHARMKCEPTIKCEARAAPYGMVGRSPFLSDASLLDGELFLQGVRDAAFQHSQRSASLPEPISLPWPQPFSTGSQGSSAGSCAVFATAPRGPSSMAGQLPALPREPTHRHKSASIDPPSTLVSPFSLLGGPPAREQALAPVPASVPAGRATLWEAGGPIWRRNSAPGGQGSEMANWLLPWADEDLTNPWAPMPQPAVHAVPELPLLGAPARLGGSLAASALLPSTETSFGDQGLPLGEPLGGRELMEVSQGRALGLGLEPESLDSMLLLDGGDLEGLQSPFVDLVDPYHGLL